MDLLEEAKRRYPIGTIFNSPNHTNIEYQINQKIIDAKYYVSKDMIEVERTTKNYRGIIYDNGVWAEIISKPKQIIQIY